MRDASLTFDPPLANANTPAVLRRSHAWWSPDGRRRAVAGLLAVSAHLLVLWLLGLLPRDATHARATLRPEQHAPAIVTIPLEGVAEPPVTEAPPASPAEAAAPQAPALRAPTRGAPAPGTAASASPSPDAAPAEPAAVPSAAPLDFSDMGDAFRSVTSAVVVAGSAHGLGSGRVGSGGLGASGSGAGGGGRAGGSGAGGVAAHPAGVTSRAQPARPTGSDWSCPWPAPAMAADLYTQQVLVRVVVDGDGGVVSARAQTDPGFGFAAAAEACARRQRYSPARDELGQPIRGTTPPIRVRFRR